MSLSPATLAAFRQLRSAAARIARAARRLDAEIRGRKTGIARAWDLKSDTALTTHERALQGDEADLKALVAAIAKVQPLVQAVLADIGFMRERDDDAARVIELVESARAVCAKVAAAIPDAYRLIARAREVILASEQVALDRANAVQSEGDALLAQIRSAQAAADKALQEGRAAVDRRRRRPLQKAQGMARALPLDTLRWRLQQWRAGRAAEAASQIHVFDLTDEGRRALEAARRRTRQDDVTLDTALQRLAATAAQVAALHLPPVDLHKALQALGLDNPWRDRLGRIFDIDEGQWRKALDALLRQAGLALDGRTALQLLRRAGLLGS